MLRHHRRARRRTLGLLLCTLFGAVLASAADLETVDLVPEEPASWRPSRLLAFLRPAHNFGERSITVETTPPGAHLDLFYVRSNFQKRYEQAKAPVKVLLPTRVQAGPRDAVNIRAHLEGYRQEEVTVRVGSAQERVHLELSALPNRLVAVSHVYFAGRASLAFLTEEVLKVRVQDREEGFHVILAETSRSAEAAAELASLRSPFIESAEALQLGEDLLVRVDTAEGEPFELRARQGRDELRDLHVYSLELVPPDGGVAAVQRAREALAALESRDLGRCALVFDAELREALEPAALARALAPSGTFTDPYLRAAMKRLGELSPGGRIPMLDGSRYDPRSGIELAAALSQAAEAEGFLALLRAFVAELESGPHRVETLRSLMAPEMGLASFETALGRAREAEARCRSEG